MNSVVIKDPFYYIFTDVLDNERLGDKMFKNINLIINNGEAMSQQKYMLNTFFRIDYAGEAVKYLHIIDKNNDGAYMFEGFEYNLYDEICFLPRNYYDLWVLEDYFGSAESTMINGESYYRAFKLAISKITGE
jgi:hypothetical protein